MLLMDCYVHYVKHVIAYVTLPRISEISEIGVVLLPVLKSCPVCLCELRADSLSSCYSLLIEQV